MDSFNAESAVIDPSVSKEHMSLFSSYSIDTARYLKRKMGKRARFFYLVGEDLAGGLKKWKKFKKLRKLTQFAVFSRPGCDTQKIPSGAVKVAIPKLDISSSEIRKRLAAGRPVKKFLPAGVYAYIKKKKLYKK